MSEDWTKDLEVGDWVSRISYMKITKLPDRPDGSFRVENESAMEWKIDANIVRNECSPPSASTTERVAQSELARLLLAETHGKIAVVNFRKKQTPDRVLQVIKERYKDGMTKKEEKKMAEDLLLGEERRLVGYVLGADVHGRIKMQDLNAPGSHKMRLVDPRTLTDVTFGGVKYEKK